MQSKPWWSSAVFYQVYPRSFADSDGDGVGDIDGVTAHLDHLEQLGVDAIWLNPVTVSPMADHGYDVADPRDIDPLFGGMAAIERLIAAAHRRGIKITMDVVPQPHQLGASVVPGGAGRRTGFRRPAALLLPGRPRRGRRAAAEQLDLGVRRVGLDPGARTRRQSRPVVSAPVRHRAARPELGAPGRLRRLREDAAVLAGARRGRLPHRRGARHGQTGRPAGFAGPRVQGVAPQRRRPALQPPERARHPPRHPQGGQRLPRRGDRRRGVGHRQRPLGGVPAARRTASGVQLPADQDRLRRRPDPRRDPELAGRHRPAGGHPDLDAVQPRRRPGGHPLRRRRGRAAPGPCDGDGDARPARRGVHLQRRGAGPARRRVARRGVAGPHLGALGTHRAGPGQMPGADALVGPGSPVRVLLAHRHLAADAEGVGGADRAKAARRPRLDVVVLPAGPRIAKAPCGIRRRRRRIGWRRPPMR